MVVHAGTHLDSPRHYFLDGPAFEDIPLDRLYGPGVVWHLPMAPDQVIEVADLERARPQLLPGDILALDTGWSARFGTDTYDRHPSLSVEATQWLVAQKIKILACDFATPDLVYHLRQDGFNWPVHNILLSQGILVCEHLTGHAPLAGQSCRIHLRRAQHRNLRRRAGADSGAPHRGRPDRSSSCLDIIGSARVDCRCRARDLRKIYSPEELVAM